FGGVMKLQFAQDAAGFSGREGSIQGSRGVGIEIVHDDPDFLGVREMYIYQVAHTGGKVGFSALVGDFGMSPACQWLKHHKQVAGAVALVFIVVTRYLTGLSRGGRTSIFVQNAGALVKTDDRLPPLVRFSIQFQHIFHPPDELRTHRRDAPLLFLPRLKFVFSRSRARSRMKSGFLQFSIRPTCLPAVAASSLLAL